MKNGFEKAYPYLHLFVSIQGWIEIGPDEFSDSWVRVLDEGGTQLEADEKTLDESLEKAEEWAKEWMTENYAKEVKEMPGKKAWQILAQKQTAPQSDTTALELEINEPVYPLQDWISNQTFDSHPVRDGYQKTKNCGFMKIIGELKGEIDIKRFYFHGELSIPCPNCGNMAVRDFDDHYLSYPVVGKAEEFDVYCKSCGNSLLVPGKIVKVTIHIEVEPDKVEIYKPEKNIED